MTRQELAEAAGISETTIGRIEREGPVDIAATWRIANALSVPMSLLIRSVELLQPKPPKGWRPAKHAREHLAEVDAWLAAVDRPGGSRLLKPLMRGNERLDRAKKEMLDVRSRLVTEIAMLEDDLTQGSTFREHHQRQWEAAESEVNRLTLEHTEDSPEDLLAAYKAKELPDATFAMIALTRYFEENGLYGPLVELLTERGYQIASAAEMDLAGGQIGQDHTDS